MANVLITGASGYLGGSFIDHLQNTADVLPHGTTVYALVRSEKQAASVRALGYEPLTFDPYDQAAVEEGVLSHGISVVFWLIDALKFTGQPLFISALAKLKAKTGREVHFVHTSGAKIFSSHAGAPTDEPLYDDDANLHAIQLSQKAHHPLLQQAVETNNEVIAQATAQGVRSYIFVPCIVYGRGSGFGNVISIQTVAVVKAALAAKRVYKVDAGKPSWPVSHVSDTATLYVALLKSILAGQNPEHGSRGYYLAASGTVVWDDLYGAVAQALAKRGVIEDATVEEADNAALEAMGQGLGLSKEVVPIQLGGKCTFTARHGASLGWKPEYPAEHILEAADAEVELILANI